MPYTSTGSSSSGVTTVSGKLQRSRSGLSARATRRFQRPAYTGGRMYRT